MMGSPRLRAASSSGLLGLTAVEMTTKRAPTLGPPRPLPRRRRGRKHTRPVKNRGGRGGEPLRRQLLLLYAPSAARFGKSLRVLQLVVVDRMRQRHENRRPAHDRELGYG